MCIIPSADAALLVARQNGDWKDHVRLANDKVVASIDVKLKNGNLLKSS